MNIHTHPMEINKVSQKISSKTLIAWTSNFNYHLVDGKLYSIFQEGLGSYPELITRDQIHSEAVYVSKVLLIEGEETTMDWFISVNMQPDVEPIEPEQLKLLNQLPINESMCVGMLEVKRIS